MALPYVVILSFSKIAPSPKLVVGFCVKEYRFNRNKQTKKTHMSQYGFLT